MGRTVPFAFCILIASAVSSSWLGRGRILRWPTATIVIRLASQIFLNRAATSMAVTGSSRYFASQFGNNQFPTAYSNGIRGYLSVADVSMRDFFCNDFVNNQNLPGFNNPKCDFLLNGLVMTTWQNDNFAQIAFVEGAVPWPPANFNSSTPKTCD